MFFRGMGSGQARHNTVFEELSEMLAKPQTMRGTNVTQIMDRERMCPSGIAEAEEECASGENVLE
jgi:uncharacterized protein YdeI (YjbR/CyaY-like superfamily)